MSIYRPTNNLAIQQCNPSNALGASNIIGMIALLITILFGLGFALFATQNTAGVTLYISNLTLSDIPIYLVVLISLLAGVSLAWIISLFNSISTFFILHRKESTIQELKKIIADLIKRVHQLELDQMKNKEKSDGEQEDEDSL